MTITENVMSAPQDMTADHKRYGSLRKLLPCFENKLAFFAQPIILSVSSVGAFMPIPFHDRFSACPLFHPLFITLLSSKKSISPGETPDPFLSPLALPAKGNNMT